MSVPRVARAARALRPNHLITPADVVEAPIGAPPTGGVVAAAASLHNAYVRVSKAPGDTFLADDVSGTPLLPRSCPLVSVMLSVEEALGGQLVPDARVDVYGIAKPAAGATATAERLVRDVRLVALVRKATPPESVALILELSPASDPAGLHQEALKLAGASDLKIVVRLP